MKNETYTDAEIEWENQQHFLRHQQEECERKQFNIHKARMLLDEGKLKLEDFLKIVKLNK